MKPCILFPLALFFILSFVTPAQAATSVRVISPNGGESYVTQQKNSITVTWEAQDVPQGAQVCVRDVVGNTPVDMAPFLDNCVPAMQGTAKMNVKLSNAFPHLLKPGTHKVYVELQTVAPVQKIGYDGRPFQTEEITKIAEDYSDQTFVILPPNAKDKKAGLLEIYEDGEKWNDENRIPVFKDTALENCRIVMGANFGHTFTCVWKGKVVASNVPSKKNKQPVKVLMNGIVVSKEKTDSKQKAWALCEKYAKGQSMGDKGCLWGNTYLMPDAVKEKVKQERETTKAKTETRTTTAPDLEAKAAKAIQNAEEELNEVREEALREENPVIRVQVLASIAGPDSWLQDAKEFFAQGDWKKAEHYARSAENEAYRLGDMM